MAAVVLRYFSPIIRRQSLCTTSVCLCQSRDNSSTNLTAYKRGRGGRSSFSGIIATVFGANGQLGHGVVTRLGRMGSQVIVPYRSEPLLVQNLKLCGDLGQILFQEFDLRDDESIRKAMKYSNVVINLIGRDWETKNFTYRDVFEYGPRRLARITREMGVPKFIHVSDIHASHDPQKIHMRHGSEIMKAKMAGEEAVLEEYPNAVIFRPSDLFGPKDKFMHYWTIKQRQMFQCVPIWKKGKETIKQPVFWNGTGFISQPVEEIVRRLHPHESEVALWAFDVSDGIVRAITNSDVDGKIIQAVGPYRYYLCDLINYFYDIMQWTDPPIVEMHPLMWMKVFVMANRMQWVLMNNERIEREGMNDVVDPHLMTLEDLGVKLTRVEDRAHYEVYKHRKHAYYNELIDQLPEVKPPAVITPRGYFE